jgi:hypothetical protein
MRRTVHCCVSVEGLLTWDGHSLRRLIGSITDEDGKPVADVRGIREALTSELAKGHKMLPIGKPCEGFSYETGCPGHDVPDEATA